MNEPQKNQAAGYCGSLDVLAEKLTSGNLFLHSKVFIEMRRRWFQQTISCIPALRYILIQSHTKAERQSICLFYEGEFWHRRAVRCFTGLTRFSRRTEQNKYTIKELFCTRVNSFNVEPIESFEGICRLFRRPGKYNVPVGHFFSTCRFCYQLTQKMIHWAFLNLLTQEQIFIHK